MQVITFIGDILESRTLEWVMLILLIIGFLTLCYAVYQDIKAEPEKRNRYFPLAVLISTALFMKLLFGSLRSLGLY